MPRKKLRNCSKCDVRHGPPIGTRCNRAEVEFDEMNRKMGDDQAEGEAKAESDVKTARPNGREDEAMESQSCQGDNIEEVPLFSEFLRSREEDRRRRDIQGGEQTSRPGRAGGRTPPSATPGGQGPGVTNGPGQGVYYQVPWENYPHHLHDYHQYPPTFRVGSEPRQFDHGGASQGYLSYAELAEDSRSVKRRMTKLESSLEQVLEAQQNMVKLQTEMMFGKKASPAQPANAAASSKVDQPDSESENETEEWKENVSDDLWKWVNGKKNKNPFEHTVYMKKGEHVDSFERVMMVTFKTVLQLLEVNQEVKGVVKHGLAMAEKASKSVYEVEAFTRYDESVRERAGAVGPGAFGVVDQEDTLRFFSYDNVKKTKGWKPSPSGSQSQKKKSDKLCLKYNDQGCASKSCYYAHKCAACEETGHARKDCTNLKKKDK